MVMRTWLLGRGSVTTERGAAIRPRILRALVGYGLGGGGLAIQGPVPGSGGGVRSTSFGVGLGGLSPGRMLMAVVPVKEQLLFGPRTTPGGGEYPPVPGFPFPLCAWCGDLRA